MPHHRCCQPPSCLRCCSTNNQQQIQPVSANRIQHGTAVSRMLAVRWRTSRHAQHRECKRPCTPSVHAHRLCTHTVCARILSVEHRPLYSCTWSHGSLRIQHRGGKAKGWSSHAESARIRCECACTTTLCTTHLSNENEVIPRGDRPFGRRVATCVGGRCLACDCALKSHRCISPSAPPESNA